MLKSRKSDQTNGEFLGGAGVPFGFISAAAEGSSNLPLTMLRI
jgi:hypothetical protein